jgi:predicted SnoaL-like aldol condensation-catalyzing enzyme
MSVTNIAKALTVLQGIGNRDQNLAIKYMHPTKFTQHNPLVSDGIDGVKEWIRRLPREKSPLKTVRAFQDGSYVIANTEGDILGQNVFFDIFRLEDDLIVEAMLPSKDLAVAVFANAGVRRAGAGGMEILKWATHHPVRAEP